MGWTKEAITDGELDALARAATAACNYDTRYPLWRGSSRHGQGECHNIARWLVSRLGGKVGSAKGHYVWLSPDESYYIDLTGGHSGRWAYAHNDAYHATHSVDNVRSQRFAKRADRVFNSLDKIIRLGLDYAGDAYPAQEPQAEDDSERFNDSWTDPEQYWHDEPDPTSPEGIYQFVYANSSLEVSPNHGHEDLAQHAGVNPAEHTGPFAAGHVVVAQGKATWEVQANVNLHAFFKILKEATKNYGWKWGGMTDAQGQPILEHEFGPKKSGRVLNYVFVGEHLLLGRTSAADLLASSDRDGDVAQSGTIAIFGKRATVSNVHVDALPYLFDWAADTGLTLYGGNDNVIKTIPDLQQEDVYNPQTPESPNPMEPPPRLDTGLYRCPGCQQLFPNWHEYSKHRPVCSEWASQDNPDANGDGNMLPSPDHNDTFGDGAHYTEMRQEPGITTGSVQASGWTDPNAAGVRVIRPSGYEADEPEDDFFELDPNDAELPMTEQALNLLWEHDLTEPSSSGDHHKGLWYTHPDLGGDYSGHLYGFTPEEEREIWAGMKASEGAWGMPNTPPQHPDPWMDNEPGATTFPAHWAKIRILPARTWREAARVDGFDRYGDLIGQDGNFYVAYRNGDPLGYACVADDGALRMIYSAVENQGIGTALYHHIMRYHLSLYTKALHDKTSHMLAKLGWVQAKGQLWKWAAGKDPKDLLEAPMPFIYDVNKDKIFTGHPGARTSDIPGKFTPGGIVEGQYEPGGKVILRSMTSVPYTVRHLIELWYYSQPHMEVKSVHLQDDAGKDTRLAAVDPGSFVKTMAAADPAVQQATQMLQAAGGEVYAVGGAVRDAIMGKNPKDIDLMVTGLPAERVTELLESLPGRVDFTGKDFGVFRYRHKGHEVEIALPRRERSTGAGHQDFDVQADHTMKPEDDFYRRDFTANAMGVNLANGRLVDPFGGTADIKSGTLRTLNDRSLAEDPLRVVRAVVAAGRHGLYPDEATRAQMADHAHGLTNLPVERIQAELDKLMTSDNPAKAIRLAHETGVLKHILPEVDEAFGFDQNNPHHELELGDHLLNVLDRITQKTKDPDLRLAALLHDIGKPGSAWQDPETGSNHYYEHHMDGAVLGADHEKLGATLAKERMEALRYPTDRITRVSELVKHHMWPGFSTEKGARRFLHRVGDHADDLLTLRWADQGGKSAYPTSDTLDLDTQRRLVDRVRNAGEATSQAQLAINGNDLIQAGITPGPIMGKILNYLTERVVDDPSVNTPDQLLTLANEFANIQE